MTLSNIFSTKEKHTFLVGAGISIDKPSNLLSGMGFIENILQRISPTSAVFEKLFSYIDIIRFERVMGVLRSTVDEQLEILNCLSDCSEYNLNHAIIAGLLLKNDIVITTNFDVLIEQALLDQFEIEPNVILEEKDCRDYLSKPTTNSIFKIHGSLSRYAQGRWLDSRDSIRATLQRIGHLGEGFELEPSMRRVLTDILTSHDLIVIGYSGSDDFDVMPLLKSVKSKARLIWVSHVADKHAFSVCSLDRINSPNIKGDRNAQCLRILQDLEGSGSWRNDRIFLIETNTQSFLQKIARIKGIKTTESNEAYDWNVQRYFDQWAQKHLSSPGLKKFICGRLFADVGCYGESIALCESCLALSQFNDVELVGEICYWIASVYSIKGEYQQAEDYCGRAIQLLSPTTSPFKASIFDLRGKICGYQGKYDSAEAYHRECLRICTEGTPQADLIASSFHYLGRIWHARGDLKKAEGLYLDAADLYSKCGHIQGNALCLHQLGVIYQDRRDYTKAKEYYEQSKELRQKLGDKLGIAASLHQLGCIEFFQGRLNGAVSLINRSLDLEREINHLHGISDSLAMLGFIHLHI